MEWAKGVVTSPIRLMERVGEYVADRVVGSPHPSADPAAKEQVADLASRLESVANATEEPAVKVQRPRKSPSAPSGAVRKSPAQKKRSPTLVVKAESHRDLPSRRARPQGGRGFYSETNLTSLACVLHARNACCCSLRVPARPCAGGRGAAHRRTQLSSRGRRSIGSSPSPVFPGPRPRVLCGAVLAGGVVCSYRVHYPKAKIDRYRPRAGTPANRHAHATRQHTTQSASNVKHRAPHSISKRYML